MDYVLTEEEQKHMQEWIDKRQARFTARCLRCKGEGRVDIAPVSPKFKVNTICDGCDLRDDLRRVAQLYWTNVPQAYRFATLSVLQPSGKSLLAMERQQAIIHAIKRNPDIGWSFFGAPGIGKTVWTTALYGNALWKNFTAPYEGKGRRPKYNAVMRTTTKKMLDEHTAYSLKSDWEDEIDKILELPTITADKINYVRTQQKQTPRLFLEEIDKVKETESRRNNLFEILDMLQSVDGQLVLNSNLTPEEFAERFGADLWWRIKKMTKVVSLF